MQNLHLSKSLQIEDKVLQLLISVKSKIIKKKNTVHIYLSGFMKATYLLKTDSTKANIAKKLSSYPWFS